MDEYNNRVADELEKLAKAMREGSALLDEVKFDYTAPHILSTKPRIICTASGRSSNNLEFSVEFGGEF